MYFLREGGARSEGEGASYGRYGLDLGLEFQLDRGARPLVYLMHYIIYSVAAGGDFDAEFEGLRLGNIALRRERVGNEIYIGDDALRLRR